MSLNRRAKKRQQRNQAEAPPPPALTLFPDCNEAAERARFEQIHGRPPALVVRLTVKDARIRPDPHEVPK